MGKRKRITKAQFVSKFEMNVVIKPQVVINIVESDAIIVEGKVVGARSSDGRIVFIEKYEDRRIVAKELDEVLSKKKVIICTFAK